MWRKEFSPHMWRKETYMYGEEKWGSGVCLFSIHVGLFYMSHTCRSLFSTCVDKTLFSICMGWRKETYMYEEKRPTCMRHIKETYMYGKETYMYETYKRDLRVWK